MKYKKNPFTIFIFCCILTVILLNNVQLVYASECIHSCNQFSKVSFIQPNDRSKIISGIDISEYQGTIDFEKVRENHIEAVYIRAAYGEDTIDPYFESNYIEAKKAGFSIGFYHYITATNDSQARTQARFFYSLIDSKVFDLYPVMDYESFTNTPSLNKSQIQSIARTYLETLSNLLGYNAAIYTDAYNARNLWDSSFNKYPLWIADFNVSSPNPLGPWSYWSGFQYSDQGIINGIDSYVDVDYFTSSMCIKDHQKKNSPTGIPRISYKVRFGDTLTSIAQKFNTTIRAIQVLNHIENPNLIYAGETLIIP